jgi:Phosphotransferase enzyme family
VSTAFDANAGLELHPFPFDPDLPRLPLAADPLTVRTLLTSRRVDAPPAIDLVHHPREGACVLRYRFPGGNGDGSEAGATYYGKVYGDGTGHTVHRFLKALSREQSNPLAQSARFPHPVVYSRACGLLVTEALPGEPLVPRLLKSALIGRSGDAATRYTAAMREAVQASGRALSALHGSDLITAPVHSAAEELARLHREIEVVSQVWPDVAARVRRQVDVLAVAPLERSKVVLSHGDYTPSQVLPDHDGIAVVDLDTLCWAEPALDIGRFLAHLQLLVAKATGDPCAPLAVDLTEAFLRGYREDGARAAADLDGHRISFYIGTTLARTSLHACRQLKDRRLEIAQHLLGALTAHDRRVEL